MHIVTLFLIAVFSLIILTSAFAGRKDGISATATVPETQYNKVEKGKLQLPEDNGNTTAELEKLEVKAPENDTHQGWRSLRDAQKDE